MNIRNLIYYSFLTLFMVLVQLFLLKNVALFGVAFGFIYLLPILILPSSIKTIPLMLIAFLMGFVLDVFYETIGMHTAAITFLAFLRLVWLRLTISSGGYDDEIEPSLSEIGLGKFISYSFPLIFLYSLTFFAADQWGSGAYFRVIYKSILSALFTGLLIIIVQLLFFKRRRGI